MKEWETKSGLKAIILFVNDSHHCGYVEVDENNALFEKDYNEKCCPKNGDDIDLSHISVISLLMNNPNSDKTPIDCFIEVHGGITFSGKIEGYSYKWLFGYDCAHAGDSTKYSNYQDDIFRDEEYCIKECENLAEQLVKFNIK